MVDLKKRKTLTLMGTATAAAAVPTLALGAMKNGVDAHHCSTDGQCTDIRLELTVAQQPTLRISNDSTDAAVVRHVHPGIVHAGAQTFDINSLLADGPLVIEPGHSVTLALKPAASATIAETEFPRHRYARMPQRIARLRGVDARGTLVDSTRSFYS